jgi:transposase
MRIVGYVFAMRSERALCREVQVNLAYRWFCGLSLEDKVPDHSVFSRARNKRFPNRTDDAGQHARTRHAVVRCVVLALPPPGGADRRSLAG